MDPPSVYFSSAPSGGGMHTLDRFIPRPYAEVFTGGGGTVLILLRRLSGAQVEVVRDTVAPTLAKIILRGDIRQIETAECCITRICYNKKMGESVINAFTPGELHDYFNERVPQEPIHQELGRRGLRRGVEGSAYKYPGMDHDIKLLDYFKYPYGQNYVDGHYPQSFQPPPLLPPPRPTFAEMYVTPKPRRPTQLRSSETLQAGPAYQVPMHPHPPDPSNVQGRDEI